MSKLNVLYQCSALYSPFAGVSMTTLFENNLEIDSLTVYLAAKDLPDDSRQHFNALAEKYGRTLIFLDVDDIYDSLLSLGAHNWNGSLATYMKLFLIDSMPEDIDQLLYIDSDTIVPGSLKELAALDLGNNLVGMVIDSLGIKNVQRVHQGKHPYFNAGIVYFNVKLWREQKIQPQMLDFLRENLQSISVADQDLLNLFCRGRILRLDPRYNFQGIHIAYRDDVYFPVASWKDGLYYTPEEILSARKNPGIIHFFRFCGEYPWQPGNIHPCKKLFETALAASLWHDLAFPRQPLLKPVFRAERILWKLLPKKIFLRLFWFLT